MFSHLMARRPGAATNPVQPAQPARPPIHATRPLVAALACVAAVAIAGCKPGILSSAPSAAPPSGSAAPSSAAAQSAASTMTAIASNASAVTSFVASLQIHGAAGAAAQITGTLTEQTQPSVLVQVQTAQPVGLAAILAGNTAYLKIGALTRMTGKPWVAVPYSGLTSGSSASLAPMIQEIQGTDPLAQTQMFPAAKDVRKVGAATINGVPTTEYSGSYSLAAGLAQLAQGLRAGVQSAMTANGITSTDFTVWVDAQHQVRKMSLVEFGRSARIEVILVIISINQPVRIQVPPAGEVVSSAVNPAPAPSMTPGTPAPAATMPAPAATPTPSPVTSQPPGGTPTPIATNSPNHW